MGNAIVQSATIQLKDQGGGVFGSRDISSGGDAALGWEGDPGQLGIITVTTDTTFNFGTRSEASQSWWQVGDRGWDKDGEVTMLEASVIEGATLSDATNVTAFDTCISMKARKGAAAGLRSDFAYESSGDGEVAGRISTIPASHATTTRKAFWGFTGRWNDDLNFIATSSYSSITGTFSDGDNTNFIAGEAFTGVKSGSGAFSGYIIKADTVNEAVSFYTEDSYNSGDNNGAVITGDISGATATFDGVTYLRPASMKITRSDTDEGATPTSPEIALAFTQVATNQLIVQTRTSTFGTDDDRPAALRINSSNWEDWNFQADFSGSTFEAQSNRNGTTFDHTYTNPDTLDFSNVAFDFRAILIATDWAGSTNQFGHLYGRFKDPHADYELNRVMVGDNVALSSCSHLSVCRSESWSSTSTDARLNYGEIPSGTESFIFVFNGSGVCVNPSTGRSLGDAP